MERKRIRVEFGREDLVSVIWALESLIEDAKYDGGLVLVEREMRLKNRLEKRLRRHDLGPLLGAIREANAQPKPSSALVGETE